MFGFSGGGPAYPLVVDGVRRLLFAGTAVVIEGLGMLKGLRGSVAVATEYPRDGCVSLTVAGRSRWRRFLHRRRAAAPLVESGSVPDATVLTLAGHSTVARLAIFEDG